MRLLFSLFLAFSLLATVPTAQAETKIHISRELGIKFNYPGKFSVGHYRIQGEAEQEGFGDNLVLLENSQKGQFSLDAIPIGDVPTISIKVLHGSEVKFARALIFELHKRQVNSKKWGSHTVHVFPGYPGPFGDQAFYYLIPWGDDKLIEITAHRYYFQGVPEKSTESFANTEYDLVIQSVVKTLEFVLKKPA